MFGTISSYLDTRFEQKVLSDIAKSDFQLQEILSSSLDRKRNDATHKSFWHNFGIDMGIECAKDAYDHQVFMYRQAEEHARINNVSFRESYQFITKNIGQIEQEFNERQDYYEQMENTPSLRTLNTPIYRFGTVFGTNQPRYLQDTQKKPELFLSHICNH